MLSEWLHFANCVKYDTGTYLFTCTYFKLARVYEEVEKDLHVLGATAVEDR